MIAMNKEYNLGILEDEEYLVLLGILANSNIDSDEMIKFNNYIIPLWKENKQLKDNWDKLKEYCETYYYGITTIGILNKMQELENGDSNE